jgi:hypothetical protein
MKKIYTLVLFAITFFNGNAQIVNIPDANFKAKLLAASPSNQIASTQAPDSWGGEIESYNKIDTNNNGEIEVSEVINIKYLDVSFSNINSLEGISSFTALEYLFCFENDIEFLDISQNLNLKGLNCYSNQLVTLNVSQNSQLTSLNCNGNQLTTLDVTQNSELFYLLCGGNLLTNLDLTQNSELYYLLCTNNQLTTLSVSQNLNLAFINCSSNQLTTLNVTQNNELLDLWCSDNQLSSLYIKNNNQIWFDLYFDENPNLVYVCADEVDLTLVQQKINDYGYTNCHANTYCSFVPGGLFYTIQGNTKYDSNNNGCDDSDINYSNLNFTISNGIESGTLITNTSGNYLVPIQEGSYSITPVLENPSYYNITPTSETIDFPSETSPFIQNFCITPNGIHYDLEVTVLPITPSRPGFDSTFKILYKNKGTQIQSGSILFTYDDTLMDFVSCSPNSYNQTTNFINMNYLDLMPTEVREFIIVMNINSPMETPPVNGGDDLGFAAIILPIENDEVPIDNHSQIKITVVNSFDPNDKTCLEGNTISPEMVGEYVHYVIRFENTGTFAAENVVITDVIDTSKFELNTLIPLSSSHNFFTRINGNKVEFIFENINLPFDDDNNDGYVAFKIKTKPNLVLGDELTNTASIYFDYNFPIITNTTSTTVEEPLSNQDFDFETNFTLYPNPAKEVLNIKVKSEMEVKSVSIYNTLGQILMTTIHSENGEINVSNLQSGSYFINVFTDKGSSTAKFIKQ